MTTVKVGNTINILNIVDFSSCWVDRVQAMRQRMGNNLGYLGKRLTFLLGRRNQEEEILITSRSK